MAPSGQRLSRSPRGRMVQRHCDPRDRQSLNADRACDQRAHRGWSHTPGPRSVGPDRPEAWVCQAWHCTPAARTSARSRRPAPSLTCNASDATIRAKRPAICTTHPACCAQAIAWLLIWLSGTWGICEPLDAPACLPPPLITASRRLSPHHHVPFNHGEPVNAPPQVETPSRTETLWQPPAELRGVP